MFCMPCLKKSNGKAFAGYMVGAQVFKLGGTSHTEALALSDTNHERFTAFGEHDPDLCALGASILPLAGRARNALVLPYERTSIPSDQCSSPSRAYRRRPLTR